MLPYRTFAKAAFPERGQGDLEKANAKRLFYEEYFAVADLPAEFYLETVRLVFQEYALALGKLQWRGRTVDPGAIRRTALLTIEGERDDICALGQTLSAQDLCKNLRQYLHPLYRGRRRPLRCFQRTALEQRYLPYSKGCDSRIGLSGSLICPWKE